MTKREVNNIYTREMYFESFWCCHKAVDIFASLVYPTFALNWPEILVAEGGWGLSSGCSIFSVTINGHRRLRLKKNLDMVLYYIYSAKPPRPKISLEKHIHSQEKRFKEAHITIECLFI